MTGVYRVDRVTEGRSIFRCPLMQTAECVVVGAGVIGLAIGRALAMRGLETILLDAESRIGSGISSRSSEVIHAGLYYPPGSLKNIFCIARSEEHTSELQ